MALWNWPLWRMRLWRICGADPQTLSLGQLVQLMYGYLLEGRDAQSIEELDASLEGRLAISLKTGNYLGLESDDPEVKRVTRLAIIELGKQRELANG